MSDRLTKLSKWLELSNREKQSRRDLLKKSAAIGAAGLITVAVTDEDALAWEECGGCGCCTRHACNGCAGTHYWFNAVDANGNCAPGPSCNVTYYSFDPYCCGGFAEGGE